ncbi:hypothetical protein [Halalkalibacter flavus]|uniref:hypothetical protein n=1 Tax=Halalkalibacter flavus TaxID=3090668 RepID=UPI002FC9AB9A
MSEVLQERHETSPRKKKPFIFKMSKNPWSMILTALGLRIVALLKPATASVVTLVIFNGGAAIGFVSASTGM